MARKRSRLHGELFRAKPFASYTSHSGSTAKMWVLPDGSRVSIPGQHYEWALEHAQFLKSRFGIDLRRVRSRGDTPIRLHLLRNGCVRVNYEHKGGRLTVEAHHRYWGSAQIKACRKIIRDNTQDIFFVALRLLNNKCLIIDDESANFVQGPMVRQVNKMRLLRLSQGPELRP